MNTRQKKISTLVVAAVVATMMLPSSALAGPVLYVDDDAPLLGDGLGWVTAYRFLQDALADAAGGGITEIRVAGSAGMPATYTPGQAEAGNVPPVTPDPTSQLTTA